MATGRELDASCGSAAGQLILRIVALLLLTFPVIAQVPQSDSERLAAAQKALDAGHWAEAAELASGPSSQSADLDFVSGLALARMQRWTEATREFESGRQKSPEDPRFLVELAGVAYKQSDYRAAKRDLHLALRLNDRDSYTREFLGTIYFLDGNLEAALKYWNAIDKPRLRSVSFSPSLQMVPSLRERAVAFNAPQILSVEALLATQAHLQNVGIFPQQRFVLTPSGNDTYDLSLHLAEKNGWGDSRLVGAVALLSGLPYLTMYPEYYNLRRGALNFTSLARWDSEKRRVSASLSMPLWDDPSDRLRLYFDARNENWNLSQTFFGAGGPLSDLNLRSAAAGAEFRNVVNGRWSWSTGLEFSYRTFRNLAGHTASNEMPFFTNTSALTGTFQVERSLLRVPEHRFVLDSSATARIGRNFDSSLGAFGKLQGDLRATWFPQARGDDYEMQSRVRGGDTVGRATLDELFQLGVERDNDLWLRGHAGTTDGRKGAAPLGRRFVLANWEMDKNIYQAGFLTVKLGPFVDTGSIADTMGLFGSQRWLWDTGIQCKLRVLGGVAVVLSYGRDLRGGKGVFYGSVPH
jgi:hypothetical protein